MSNPFLRENINGAFVILWCWLLVLFVRYLWRATKRPRWYDEAGAKTAIAITVVMTGVAIRYAALWHQWFVYNRHDGLNIQPGIQWTIIGGGISIMGALCCIRIFAPHAKGNTGWIAAALFTLGVLTALHFVR